MITGLTNIFLLSFFIPATYYDASNEAEGQGEHLLHFFLARFSRRSGQELAQMIKAIHHFFLRRSGRLGVVCPAHLRTKL